MGIRQATKVLFICTGNSCRSVMAEGLLRHWLAQHGRNDVQVASAGTSASMGVRPTPETVEVMAELGIDVAGHVGCRMTPELVRAADVIFCMERLHKSMILAIHPEAEGKVHLLKAFENPQAVSDSNIPDPIGLPKEVYETCRMTIQEAVERVGQWLGC